MSGYNGTLSRLPDPELSLGDVVLAGMQLRLVERAHVDPPPGRDAEVQHSIEVGLGRVRKRSDKLDWCETEGRLTWARRVFETWARQRDNIVLVDATPSPEEVLAQIWPAVERASMERFGRLVWE